MQRIELPDGAWAEMRDRLGSAPRRLTKAVTEAQVRMASLPMFKDAFDGLAAAGDKPAGDALKTSMSSDDVSRFVPLIEALNEAQILACVTAWSYDLPISAESLDEIPGDAFDRLATEAQGRSQGEEKSMSAMTDPTPALAASSA